MIHCVIANLKGEDLTVRRVYQVCMVLYPSQYINMLDCYIHAVVIS